MTIDFAFSRSPSDLESLASLLTSYCAAGQRMSDRRLQRFDGPWGCLVALAWADEDAGAIETPHGVALMLGSEALVTNSGRSARDVLGELAQSPDSASALQPISNEIDSPFLAFALDKKLGTLTIASDMMGALPAYFYEGDGTLIVASHPDVIAGLVRPSLDPVSAAEFVLASSISYPHTLWSGITQYEPACILSHNRDGAVSKRTTRRPIDEPRFTDFREAVAEARQALLAHCQRATQGLSRVGCLLSGGEDSRLILAALRRTTEVDGYTTADEPNREMALAARVCRAYGASPYPIWRSPTNMATCFESKARMASSSAEFNDAHHIAVIEGQVPYSTRVFGGYLSGSVAKQRSSFRPLDQASIETLESRIAWIRPVSCSPGTLSQDLLKSVVERRVTHRQILAGFRERSAHYWQEFWPLSVHDNIGYYWSTRRIARVCEPFLVPSVVSALARIPGDWLRNRRFFHALAAPLLRRSWPIPHSEGFLPAASPTANSVLQPTILSYRKFDLKVLCKLGSKEARRARRRSHSIGIWNDLGALDSDGAFDRVDAALDDEISELTERILAGGRAAFYGLRHDARCHLRQIAFSANQIAGRA